MRNLWLMVLAGLLPASASAQILNYGPAQLARQALTNASLVDLRNARSIMGQN